MADRGDGFTKSVDAMRATARWTLAAFAAVGTVLVAGSQLSSIGQFEAGAPRLWAAVIALGVVLGVTGLAVWFVIAVETAGEVSLGSLAREEERPGSADAMFLRKNPALLGGFASARALDEAYQRAISARYDAIATGSQDEINAAQQWVMYLGDVRLIEDEQGRRYRLSGPRRALLSHRYRAELADVDVDEALVDPDPWGTVADASAPHIQTIAPSGRDGSYLAHVEGGEPLAVSARELKTLLEAPQPQLPLR